MNKKLLIFIATGFEDTELISSINIFNRNQIGYDLVSIENLKMVKGQNEAIVNTKLIDNVNLSSYIGVVLPGGRGHKLLLENNDVINTVKSYYQDNKLIAAICAAPEILKKSGILNNKKYTSYPGFALGEKNTSNEIEVDQNLITGKDYLSTISFANHIVKHIKK